MRLQIAPIVASFVLFVGCKHVDRGVIYTEQGLEAASEQWDEEYRAIAAECAAKHQPKTPEMETCFGETYDLDAQVAEILEKAVKALRAYWAARAAGEHPDLLSVMGAIQAMIDVLPPDVAEYFDRVQGFDP